MNPLSKILVASMAIGLASGCGLSSQFYAELEEPGICKQVLDIPMDPTNPGEALVKTITIPLAANIPLFDTSSGNVTIRLLSVTFTAKSGIQDFNSVDHAVVMVKPDPGNTSGLMDTEVLEFTKDPGVVLSDKLSIPLKSEVDLVPFLDSMGQFTIEATMEGGLPNNNWVSDVEGCIYTRARIQYLDAYGIHF